MIAKEAGALPTNRAPNQESKGLNQTSTNINYSANSSICKPPSPTFSGIWNRERIKAQLQAYLDLGLTPIPLNGKIPIVKWRHDWNPKTIEDLGRYVDTVSNWGVRTGTNLSVIDFDTRQAFIDFAVRNIEKLPEGIPIVQTGRGYHIWFKPTQPLKDMHFEGIDIKGEGGQVVAPPSIHRGTGKRYRFINAPKGFIPELDITGMVFPDLKKREAVGNGSIGVRGSTSSTFIDKPKFDFDLIKDGVDSGQRNTALVSYTGHLIWRGLLKDEIKVLTNEWNRNNRPPLPKEELDSTVEDCYARYVKDARDNNDVSTETLNINSVIVGTKNYSLPTQQEYSYSDDSPDTPASAWDTEYGYTQVDCGKKRSIIRRGRDYRSVSFFCGKWSCPKCGPHFRNRWIEHMVKINKDQDLYITEISEADWGRIRRSINRLGADYMRITAGGVIKIITDKPLDGSTGLAQEDIQTYLESSIPNTTDKCPISTSRNWERRKKEKTSNDYEAVITTWLPVKEQAEVALGLGAKVVKHARWFSPKGTDEEEWAEQFKQGIRGREEFVLRRLENPRHCWDMQRYLNWQYANDAENDEYGKEFMFDEFLVEAN